MECGLKGKVALVTGASRGIGRAIALELATKGCHVAMTARDQAKLDGVAAEIRNRGGSATTYPLDLRPVEAANALANKVSRDLGRIDILVNNAGAVKRGSFFDLTEDVWQDGFALKFFAHVRLSRAVWPMLRGSKGSVVFISGIGARAPVADYMIGASVIGASLAFMRALADIGKEDGVQVLAINPGSVDTDRFRGRLEIIMRRTGLDEAAAKERHRRELDITRFGEPEDIAGLVSFVVSSRGRWLHGTSIDMDGGQWVPLRMSRYNEPVNSPNHSEEMITDIVKK